MSGHWRRDGGSVGGARGRVGSNEKDAVRSDPDSPRLHCLCFLLVNCQTIDLIFPSYNQGEPSPKMSRPGSRRFFCLVCSNNIESGGSFFVTSLAWVRNVAGGDQADWLNTWLEVSPGGAAVRGTASRGALRLAFSAFKYWGDSGDDSWCRLKTFKVQHKKYQLFITRREVFQDVINGCRKWAVKPIDGASSITPSLVNHPHLCVATDASDRLAIFFPPYRCRFCC